LPILIVEDDLQVAFALEECLRDLYDVETAVSAEVALASLREAPFAAAIVDVSLPGMDGYSLIRVMWADAVLRNVPVIIVSGGDIAALPGNSVAFLRKPVDPSHLVGVLARCAVASVSSRSA
jgi:CheY-like chemotaxis protein